MIIDCHGHFTTVPASFREWRAKQVAAANDPANAPSRDGAYVSDDQIREAIGNGQLKLQKERGYDITLFSPIAGLMSHHLGNERTSLEWAEISNDLVYRVSELFPDNFVPVCQLPQSPLAPPKNVVPELRRCVEQLGFVGCNLKPSTSRSASSPGCGSTACRPAEADEAGSAAAYGAAGRCRRPACRPLLR